MEVLVYDWREAVDWSRVNDLISGMSKPYFTEVDDGSDSYTIVITEGPVTQEEAEKLLKKLRA